jgi:hypothetical protein
MTPDHEEPLTFNWPGHGQVSLALPGFIILSILIHAVTFLVFRIVYPVSASILPPPAQVALVTPSSDTARSFLRWLETQDATALTRTGELMPVSLLDLAYRPSYAGRLTRPVVVGEHQDGIAYPPVRNPLALLRADGPAQSAQQEKITAPRTTALFSGGLAGRTLKEQPSAEWQTRAESALAAARFLVCANARGEVRGVFLQSSSGNAAMDRQAAEHLGRLSFAPADAPFTWGFATFHWGGDAFKAAPKP